MSRKAKNENKNSSTVQELVTVAFAEDLELAQEYKQMLADNEIPAVIRRQPEMAQNGFSDIAILVPEDCLDDAHMLISEQAAYDDFFDMAFGDSAQDSPEAEEYDDFI